MESGKISIQKVDEMQDIKKKITDCNDVKDVDNILNELDDEQIKILCRLFAYDKVSRK